MATLIENGSKLSRAMRVVGAAHKEGRLSEGDAMILRDILHHRDLPACFRQDQGRVARQATETLARLKSFLVDIEASLA